MKAILFEFRGGPLDGSQFFKDEWPDSVSLPATEIVDKPTGSLYRYHLRESWHHAVYTYRPEDSAK